MIARQIPTARRPARALRAAVRAEKPERMFSDAEWERAFKQAAAEASQRQAAAAAVEGGSSSGSASAVAEAKPEGRMFSDAEWDRAFKQAAAQSRAAAGEPEPAAAAGSAGDAPTTRSMPLNMNIPAEDRLFSDAEWEAAIKEVSAKVKEMKAAEPQEVQA